MKYNFYFVLITLSLLVLGGCAQQGDQGTQPEGPYTYSTGSPLTVRFLPDEPVSSAENPYSVDEEILVVAEVTNMLPEAIPEGSVKIRLTGDAAIPNYFSGGSQEIVVPQLEARDETGATAPEEVELGPLKYQAELPSKTQKIISGEYCYQYPVKVRAFLYYTTKQAEIGNNLPASSHPPADVRITQIRQYPVKVNGNTGTLKFRVTVQNVGGGKVLPGMDSCFQYQERNQRERVKLMVRGAYDMHCENDGIVELSRDTKTKTIDCYVENIDVRNLNSYPSEIALTLTDFAYQKSIDPATIFIEP